MRITNLMKNLLLVLLLALSASGAVSAKVASGPQNLGANLHRGESVFNWLMHQGKTAFSVGCPSGCLDVTNGGSTLDLLKNAERTKSGLKVDNATLQQIGAAEARGGKGFSGLTPNVVQNKPATWHGEKTGGTQTVIKYQDAAGQTKFTVHSVTDGAGKVVHRDFDSVLIQSGQQVVK
ncbi:MAG: hypothetical protein COV52_02080 [Gammaproteobacteria bacterium CG11_big_fil_rev_8_21_14_0_20_46_22]|nr:MAG: hypothetical protein COW05_08355 [Gammaproteobacteria bacterium CG12_big_fil_rev_8_21_14_0_65_46_12]PIR11794.1 MAG: hypothetical protein COV52_02080 [Gammaproteobacteria bacterium CG11_big_fil_rev_8_21_14_0_20_46_22]